MGWNTCLNRYANLYGDGSLYNYINFISLDNQIMTSCGGLNFLVCLCEATASSLRPNLKRALVLFFHAS